MAWSELFERAKELAAGCDIEPSMPKASANQHNRADVTAVTPKHYWYKALCLPLVDHLIQELNDRLLIHSSCSFTLPGSIPRTYTAQIDRDTTGRIYNVYPNNLTTRSFDGKRDERLPRGRNQTT